MPMPAFGPFESIDDVAPVAHGLHQALAAVDPTGTSTLEARRRHVEIRHRYLLAALEQVDAGLGAHDIAVARSLVGLPVETLVVIADWLARASAAGNAALLAEAADWIKPCPRPTKPGGKCRHGDWTACERTDLAWRLKGLDPEQARRDATAGRK